ncbi:MAG TPA: proteasome activator [Actinomycetota bacterium]|nr:proteasome activator [Actinomycetota bacterium]
MTEDESADQSSDPTVEPPADASEGQPVLQAVPVPGGGEATGGGDQDAIAEPGKLLRIAAMVRELLEETRGAPLDERGRTRLRQIYERSVDELKTVLPDQLERELQEFVLPLEGVPTESEMRVAQAQLVGWLEGLFHGIQAAMVAQQQAAMQQLQELRRRGLPPGAILPGMQGMQPTGAGDGERDGQHGQYL